MSTYHTRKLDILNVKHALKRALDPTFALSTMETIIVLDVSLFRAQNSKAPMPTLALVVEGDIDDHVRLADSGETGGRLVGLLAVDLDVQRVEDFCAWGFAGASDVLQQ